MKVSNSKLFTKTLNLDAQNTDFTISVSSLLPYLFSQDPSKKEGDFRLEYPLFTSLAVLPITTCSSRRYSKNVQLDIRYNNSKPRATSNRINLRLAVICGNYYLSKLCGYFPLLDSSWRTMSTKSSNLVWCGYKHGSL